MLIACPVCLYCLVYVFTFYHYHWHDTCPFNSLWHWCWLVRLTVVAISIGVYCDAARDFCFHYWLLNFQRRSIYIWNKRIIVQMLTKNIHRVYISPPIDSKINQMRYMFKYAKCWIECWYDHQIYWCFSSHTSTYMSSMNINTATMISKIHILFIKFWCNNLIEYLLVRIFLYKPCQEKEYSYWWYSIPKTRSKRIDWREERLYCVWKQVTWQCCTNYYKQHISNSSPSLLCHGKKNSKENCCEKKINNLW